VLINNSAAVIDRSLSISVGRAVHQEGGSLPLRLSSGPDNTYTHTHRRMCGYVCVCERSHTNAIKDSQITVT